MYYNMYEGISEDESVFELIDDMKMIRSHAETIAEFELDYFDDIMLENGDAAIVRDLVNDGNSGNDNDAVIASDLVDD